ncbi:UNVERIFIED_CONTAM: hypothetical protein K2H54_062050 [Gekko kuhli]
MPVLEQGTKTEEKDNLAGNGPQILQVGSFKSFWRETVLPPVNLELSEPCWEAQWKKFLKMVESAHRQEGSSPKLEPASVDTAGNFPPLLVGAAEPRQQPREKPQLLPNFGRQVQHTDSEEVAKDHERCGEVKEEILEEEASGSDVPRAPEKEEAGTLAEVGRALPGRWQRPFVRALKQEDVNDALVVAFFYLISRLGPRGKTQIFE